jgi:hypothetical protein
MEGGKKGPSPKIKIFTPKSDFNVFSSKLPLKFIPAFSNRFYLVMTCWTVIIFSHFGAGGRVCRLAAAVFALARSPGQVKLVQTSGNYERICLNKQNFFLNLAFGQVGEQILNKGCCDCIILYLT